MTARHLTRILLTGTLLTAFASNAFALDGNAFAAAINHAYAGSGAKIVFSKVDVDGDTVVLHDATLQVPGEPKLPATDLTFTGVAETADGGYSAKSMSIPDVDYAKDGNRISITQIHADGLTIPADAGKDAPKGIILYHSAHTGPVTIANKDGEIATAKSVTSTIDAGDGGTSYKTALAVEGLTLHLDRMKDPKVHDAVTAMGYDTVTGRLDVDGMWQSDKGRVEVSHLGLDLDNVGKLNLELALNGYTKDFMDSLRELQAKAAAHPHDKQSQQALGIGLLGLLQQLSFSSAAVRFDDHSVTHKALSYVGKKQGVSADQVAMVATAMLPLGLAKLKNPEFEQQISDAVGTFLKEPKNIEVRAKPDKPVPFPMIMGAAMASPQTLPDVLSATVSANK